MDYHKITTTVIAAIDLLAPAHVSCVDVTVDTMIPSLGVKLDCPSPGIKRRALEFR